MKIFYFFNCREALADIFDRCDLDENGYLSREEFNLFHMKSAGEECDDDAWEVMKGEEILEALVCSLLKVPTCNNHLFVTLFSQFTLGTVTKNKNLPTGWVIFKMEYQLSSKFSLKTISNRCKLP